MWGKGSNLLIIKVMKMWEIKIGKNAESKGKKGKEGRKGKKNLVKRLQLVQTPKSPPTDYKNTSINPNPKDPTYGEKGATYILEKKLVQKQRQLGHRPVHTQEP